MSISGPADTAIPGDSRHIQEEGASSYRKKAKPPDGSASPPGSPETRPRRSKFALTVSLILVAVAGVLATVSVINWLGGSKHPKVPDLAGTELEDLPAGTEEKWNVQIYYLRSGEYEAGEIISTDPLARTPLEEGSELTITVSLGEPLPRLHQSLLGSTVAEIGPRLEGLGLRMRNLILIDENREIPLSPDARNRYADYTVEGFDVPTIDLSPDTEVKLLIERP